MSIEKQLEDLVIIPKVHPSHYLLHKYWGRKPHNLVSSYIALFTKPGDKVIDPFMGSGGVVIESNKMNRIGIGVDLNPMACLIVKETLRKNVDFKLLKRNFDEIVESIPDDVISLTYTKDDEGGQHIIDNAIWEHDRLTRIKFYNDKIRVTKDADKNDQDVIKLSKKLLKKYEDSGQITYPKDEIMAYVRRSGKKYIYELFTERNLLIASFFIAGVREVKDESVRNALMFIFTSALPSFSSMIPGDVKSVNGKSGWQISKFWVPQIHSEKNVINTLKTRLRKYIKGKNEIDALSTNTDFKIYNQSSENLSNVEDGSVDYVFTDPPYGDSISYFALSSFWSTWLEHTVDYDGEIIYDPYRSKREGDYSFRLDKSFEQVHRVLKDGGYLSFTFHNRHVKFWKIVIDAVKKAGFRLVNVKWVDQAVGSGTQGINRANTLRGDFVYTFKKLSAPKYKKKIINGENIIDQTISSLLDEAKYVTTAKLYESLIPELINAEAYYDSKGKLLDIDGYIAQKYKYNAHEDGQYGWSV